MDDVSPTTQAIFLARRRKDVPNYHRHPINPGKRSPCGDGPPILRGHTQMSGDRSEEYAYADRSVGPKADERWLATDAQIANLPYKVRVYRLAFGHTTP